jgi:transcriptional regulator with XRE-family HTH domain
MESLNIPAFLSRKKLKQRELAESLGVSLGFIGQLATGRSKVSYDVLLKLIDLGINMEELFGVEYSQKLIRNGQEIGTIDYETMLLKYENLVKNLEAQEKTKEEKANMDFYSAKNCLEKQNIEKKDVIRHFTKLASHYSTLVKISKKLDSMDFVRLNNLNDFIKDKYKKEYFINFDSSVNNFYFNFQEFVLFCYSHKQEYFEKAIEVLYSLENKIKKENKSLSEFTKMFVEWAEPMKEAGLI